MKSSKGKPPRPPQPSNSDFAEMALKAMQRAQRAAARENARYGLPLIVQHGPNPSRGGRTRPGKEVPAS